MRGYAKEQRQNADDFMFARQRGDLWMIKTFYLLRRLQLHGETGLDYILAEKDKDKLYGMLDDVQEELEFSTKEEDDRFINQELGQAESDTTLITQPILLALGFHKIIWNNIIPSYWLPMRPETGDYIRDRQFCIEVRFNEYKDDIPDTERVYLMVVQGSTQLKQIKSLEDLLKLIELLSGQKLGSEG